MVFVKGVAGLVEVLVGCDVRKALPDQRGGKEDAARGVEEGVYIDQPWRREYWPFTYMRLWYRCGTEKENSVTASRGPVVTSVKSKQRTQSTQEEFHRTTITVTGNR